MVKIERFFKIEHLLPFLRVGLLLGLMAWFMQLVVFVQPFLPGSTAPGFGVCQIIIEAFQATDFAKNTLAEQQHTPDSTHGNMHMQHGAMPMLDDAPSHAAHQHSSHHSNHLSCGFCSLFGHVALSSMPPPVWFEQVQRSFVTLPRFIDLSIDVLRIAYLQPKSRAPPLYFIY